MEDDAGEPVPASCRAILAAWRANPEAGFGPGYEMVGRLFGDIAAARASGRLDETTAQTMADGAAVRAGRGDPVDAIMAWVEAYALRRGYRWRAPR